MKTRKYNWIILLTIAFAVIVSCVFLAQQPASASWETDNKGTYYENENGEIAVGFTEIDGVNYYFGEDGYLQTGKFYVKEENAYYYADKDGVIQTGVIATKKSFYVADDTGKIQTGFIDYENARYYFNEKADLVKGWLKADGNWYYADDDGVIMTGFIMLDGYRYYLGDDGVRVSDTVMEIDGITYIFNKDGSVDENATALYPVYQYMMAIRTENELPELQLDSKVQACAILRASELQNGYGESETGMLETLLKNRGVNSSGGYEFSYGGMEEYGIDRLLSDIARDINLENVLQNTAVTGVGLGVYQKDNISYYDIIFVCGQ